MNRKLILIISLFILQTTTGSAHAISFKRTALCDPLYKFVRAVMSVTDQTNESQRWTNYNLEQQRLLDAARQHFGPNWDAAPFIQDMRDFVNHQEMYRRPPAGWDYDPEKDITMFHSIGRHGLAIYERLTEWCWKPDHRGG
jgi:hypothetical protein